MLYRLKLKEILPDHAVFRTSRIAVFSTDKTLSDQLDILAGEGTGWFPPEILEILHLGEGAYGEKLTKVSFRGGYSAVLASIMNSFRGEDRMFFANCEEIKEFLKSCSLFLSNFVYLFL